MRTMDIINLLAILLGPILAVQIQKWIENRKENKQRKTDIFKTLMATRGTVLSPYHVEALNRIDLEFSNNIKYKKVVSAWKEYFDNLSIRIQDDKELIVWKNKNDDLLANLLYEMGIALNYDFDKALIKRNWYTPVGHGNIENENSLIRQGVIKLLNGEAPLSVDMVSLGGNQDEVDEQKKLRELLLEYYELKISSLKK